jgi:uncharacterized membrane protein YhhN
LNITGILIAIVILMVVILIAAEIRKLNRIIYVVKPLSTLLVIAVAVLGLGAAAAETTYVWLVIIGLLFSLGGDVALMPPDSNSKFRIGLLLFLSAHIIYIAAFWFLGSFVLTDIISAVILTVVALAFYRLIRRNLGAMKIPVIIYMAVICLMVNRALSTRVPLIIVGALLFFVSDMLLALNRFFKKWKYERISLAFYYGGQFLIALSTSAIRGVQ